MSFARHKLSRRALLGAGAAAGIIAATSPSRVRRDKSRRQPTAVQLKYVCTKCGGDAVTRDAWAEWDFGKQEWVLGATFDYAFCHDCEDEARLREIQIDGAISTAAS
jgi:hypothetical protein